MKQLSILVAGIAIIGLSACGSSNDFAKNVKKESKFFDSIAEQYEDGEDLAKSGEKKITKGRKLVEKGRVEIRDGEKMVREGNQMVQTSSNAYASQTGYVSQPFDPAEITASSEALKKIRKDWITGTEKVRKGNEKIAEGNSKIDKGNKLIRDGRNKVETGRSYMKNAEEKYSSRIN